MKLFVALPTTHGSMASRFLEGIMDLMKHRTIEMHIRQYIDPYIVLARNAAAADFLESDCTHMLFIDADILFRYQHIDSLVSRNVDIVGGLYAKKAEGPIKWVCNALPSRPEPDASGLLELKHIGTGFLMISRAVFERTVEKHGDQIGYLEDEIDRPMFNFFQMPLKFDDNGKPRVLSEDWFFCERCRDLGFKVYGDIKVLLNHIGSAIFPLKSQRDASREATRIERQNDFAVQR